MIYLIPEAGGAAGIGAQSIAQGLGLTTVRVDSDPSVSDLCVPRGSEFAHLIEDFARGKDVVVLPTAERTAPVYAALARCGIVAGWFSEEAYMVSRDKLLMSGFPWAQPASVSTTGPLFRKPRSGSGAVGCLPVSSREDVFCEESVYFDILNEPYCVVDIVGQQAWSRRVLKQKGGSDIDMIFESKPELEEIALSVASDLRAHVLNVQFMYADDSRPLVIDIAPRFSGASSCLMHAGVNPLRALLYGEYQKLTPCRVTMTPKWISTEAR